MKNKPDPRCGTFVAEPKKFKRRFSKWEGIAFRAAPLEFARLAKSCLMGMAACSSADGSWHL
jgi:hypothetical protein